MSNTYRTLLMDLDGTLVDTAPDFAVAVNQLRHAHGLPDADYAHIRERCSYGATTLTRWSLNLSEDNPDLTAELLQYYGAHNGQDSVLFPGMEDLIEHCLARQIAWGVVTNKPKRYTQPLLEKLLPEAPDCTLCPEDVSAPKPDAEPMIKAAQMLKCSPQECIYIGDHGRDCQAAKAANMAFGVAGWGYLSALDPWEGWHAEYFFKTPAEITALVAVP